MPTLFPMVPRSLQSLCLGFPWCSFAQPSEAKGVGLLGGVVELTVRGKSQRETGDIAGFSGRHFWAIDPAWSLMH